MLYRERWIHWLSSFQDYVAELISSTSKVTFYFFTSDFGKLELNLLNFVLLVGFLSFLLLHVSCWIFHKSAFLSCLLLELAHVHSHFLEFIVPIFGHELFKKVIWRLFISFLLLFDAWSRAWTFGKIGWFCSRFVVHIARILLGKRHLQSRFFFGVAADDL